MKTLLQYLRAYQVMQDKIMLVWRDKPMRGWNHRHMYLSEEFSPKTPYNHRSMLDNEVVIEFDDEDVKKNRKWADEVTYRLNRMGISYSKWYSGNKSTHVHTFIDPKGCQNIPLLKSCFIRFLCKGLGKPDLRLTSMNHLIRAEHGIHEKTGRKKTKIYETKGYPSLGTVPEGIWHFYVDETNRILKQKASRVTKDMAQSEAIKFLMNSTNIREKVKDGRSRVLFLLTAALKDSMELKQLEDFMCEWYRYSGGLKLTDMKVRENVRYIVDKGYNVTETTIYNYLDEIGFDTKKMEYSL